MKKSSVLFVLMAASGICFSSVYAQKRLVLDLNSNPDAIEQVAREKYLMKKPNEDIYVFEDNK